VVGEPVVLVNRTSLPLTFVCDSRPYDLKPGPNYGFVQGHALYAIKQNPLMGSENYSTLGYQSLVGIEGNDEWPCEPITDEQLLEAWETGERFDRKSKDSPLIQKVKAKAKAARLGRIDGGGAGANAMAIGGV
jgi:hypothetical protein